MGEHIAGIYDPNTGGGVGVQAIEGDNRTAHHRVVRAYSTAFFAQDHAIARVGVDTFPQDTRLIIHSVRD
jgi:hypothetical protein